MQLVFGSGTLWGTPVTDAFGASITTPTPVKLGVLQDAAVDFGFEIKKAYGGNQFPIAVARGKGSITGKANLAQINGSLLNSLVFGQTMTSGIIGDFIDTTGTAIPTTPFTITPVTAYTAQLPAGATFFADLGVVNGAGVPFTRVASGPTAGQYSLTGGVYTFAAADTGITVFISFQYTASSTSAKKMTVFNVPMGYAPTFTADLVLPYNGKYLLFQFPSAVITKWGVGSKLDDFAYPSIDFEAMADSLNRICVISTTEA